MHACYLARAVGISAILVPVYPGINCATGLLQTNVRHSYLRSAVGSLGRFPANQMNEMFAELGRQATSEASDEGFDGSAVKLTRQVELRYPHQGYTLAVDCPFGNLLDQHKAQIKSSFDALHKKIYGQAADEDPELVTFRVTSEIAVPIFKTARIEAGNGNPERALAGQRQLYDADLQSYFTANVYDRKLLRAGDAIKGPAIVDQYDSTTVILSDFKARVDPFGLLSIKRR